MTNFEKRLGVLLAGTLVCLALSLVWFVSSVSSAIDEAKDNGGLKKELTEIWEGKDNGR